MKMQKFVFTSLVVLGMWISAAFALQSPVTMLDGIANQVIKELKNKRATLKTNPGVVYHIINTHLIPYVDRDAMSRSALGRSSWESATAQQKQRFAEAFTKVLIRTYASALENYTDEAIEFLPLRTDYNTASRIQVESKIIRPDGPPIRLNYRLIRRGNNWKVYDMSVEGVSLLQSFRTDFAEELARGSLDTLIQRLEARK